MIRDSDSCKAGVSWSTPDGGNPQCGIISLQCVCGWVLCVMDMLLKSYNMGRPSVCHYGQPVLSLGGSLAYAKQPWQRRFSKYQAQISQKIHNNRNEERSGQVILSCLLAMKILKLSTLSGFGLSGLNINNSSLLFCHLYCSSSD